jgi:hypothetical protein
MGGCSRSSVGRDRQEYQRIMNARIWKLKVNDEFIYLFILFFPGERLWTESTVDGELKAREIEAARVAPIAV